MNINHFSFFQCNNPKTKEPKLVAAARIVPEWTTYDDELKKMIEEYHKEKEGGSRESGAPSTSADARKDRVGVPRPDVIDPQSHTEL